MYQFSENINYDAFFWFEKKRIENLNWAMLPMASKAVYPVICSYANESGISFPGERTIAILSGLSDKIARQGINDLSGFPGIESENYTTKRGKRSKRFKINLPKENNKDCFPFHRYLLESGYWSELKPTAKALYIAMRHFSWWDLCEYESCEEDEIEGTDFDGIYTSRKYDFVTADRVVLCKHANINIRSFKSAVSNLEDNKLLNTSGKTAWQIYSKSTWMKKRDYLNNKIMRSYRHEQS